MLIVITENQLISPQELCQCCLLADSKGQPRWREGKLGCGHPLNKAEKNLPVTYECEMGFKITNIE
jgi:hypothetical protein